MNKNIICPECQEEVLRDEYIKHFATHKTIKQAFVVPEKAAKQNKSVINGLKLLKRESWRIIKMLTRKEKEELKNKQKELQEGVKEPIVKTKNVDMDAIKQSITELQEEKRVIQQQLEAARSVNTSEEEHEDDPVVVLTPAAENDPIFTHTEQQYLILKEIECDERDAGAIISTLANLKDCRLGFVQYELEKEFKITLIIPKRNASRILGLIEEDTKRINSYKIELR